MNCNVENGIYIGETLCNKREDQHLQDLGVKFEPDDYWLPICIDLRVIASIRQRSLDGEGEGWTVMEGINDDVIYTVNTSMNELMPHFIRSRS